MVVPVSWDLSIILSFQYWRVKPRTLPNGAGSLPPGGLISFMLCLKRSRLYLNESAMLLFCKRLFGLKVIKRKIGKYSEAKE